MEMRHALGSTKSSLLLLSFLFAPAAELALQCEGVGMVLGLSSRGRKRDDGAGGGTGNWAPLNLHDQGARNDSGIDIFPAHDPVIFQSKHVTISLIIFKGLLGEVLMGSFIFYLTNT